MGFSKRPRTSSSTPEPSRVESPPGGLASRQPGPQPEQSSGERGLQQAALPRKSRILSISQWRSWIFSFAHPPPSRYPPSPSRNSPTNQPSQLPTISGLARSHSLHTGSSTLKTANSLYHLSRPATATNVTAGISANLGSPSSSSAPISPLALHPQSKSIAGGNSAPPLYSEVPETKPPPDPHPSVDWLKTLEIAKKKLEENNLPPLNLINLTSQSAQENMGYVVKALEDLQSDDKKKRWSYTWCGKEVIVVERLGKILKSIDSYSKVVGTAIQVNPQAKALVWVGIWAIMQVTLKHIEAIEGLEVAIAALLEKMTICEFYSGIYFEVPLSPHPTAPTANSLRLKNTIDSALPELYAAVIVFSVKARTYFEARGIDKFAMTLKSFDVEFRPFIEEINKKDKVIREFADAATMEHIRNIKGILQDITIDLSTRFKSIHDDKMLELLKMLTPLEPLKRHQDVKLPRSQNTGTWLLKLESFSEWRGNTIAENGRAFCCYGIPGAGKTVISSVVIDNLRFEYPVACLYADYKDQASQTLAHILGSFLHQFLTTSEEPIPNAITEKLQNIQRQRGKVAPEDNLTWLKEWLCLRRRAFICIDAVDELKPDVRQQLFAVLKDLGTNNTRLFLTGRSYITNEVQECFKVVPKYKVPISAREQDIKEFVCQQIEEDRNLNPDAMDEALANDIEDAIIKKSQGMFLLPTLHIRIILGMPTMYGRREALKTLPPGLYDSFQGIITRIRECSRKGHAKLGLRVLMWLHLANRPLKLVELQHALAVEKGHTELDVQNIPSQKALLDSCLGLVIVDEETLTVRFVHYTLEEYFREDTTRAEFRTGHNYITETCLTYLTFDKLKQHCTSLDSLNEIMNEYVFLNYAALHWGNHAKQQPNGRLTNLAKMIVDHESERPPCAIQALYLDLDRRWPRSIAKKFSGIHATAYFGLSKSMGYLRKLKRDMELKDESDQTPLSWAAEYGHKSIVQMLIKDDSVDINSKDSHYGNTPLSWAAKNGHEDIVQLLTNSERHGVDINIKDNNYGHTPLSQAALNGHVAVVRLLIKRKDIDINAKSKDGKTPLSEAATEGQEDVVRLLIERGDVDINAKDDYGWTPLLWVAAEGHEAVAQLLIERPDIDINARGRDGQTPLSKAARNGYEAVVKLLVKREDVDINAKDRDGRTPLSEAATEGHEAIAQLLLERSDTDINVEDKDGWTPLLQAVAEGRGPVVRLLIDKRDVGINTKDKDGWTSLAWAAGEGYEDIARLLLTRDDVDLDPRDKDGWTPLLRAASEGYETITRLLIEKGGVDINAKENDGGTPLAWAARHGREAVVGLLIERDDVDISAKDKDGRTPFSLAAEKGSEAVVRLLVEKGVDINVEDKDGRTPLSWAAEKGNEAVVRLLIERDVVDINAKDKDGRTPLSWAAEKGNEAVVRLLIEKDVDINVEDKYGQTPLSVAIKNRHEAVIRLLNDLHDVRARDSGTTPADLCYGANNLLA